LSSSFKTETKGGKMSTRRVVNRDIIHNFLALLPERQRDIQEKGRGTYCLLVPSPRAQYPYEQYPELYARNTFVINHQGEHYIVLANFTLGEYMRCSKLPGSILIPYSADEKPIEDILS